MLSSIVVSAIKIIDKIIPDKEEANKAKIKLLELEQKGELFLIESQSRVIEAEVKSDSWMARNWRPILMLLFGTILANNYIIGPWLNALGYVSVALPIPERMWSLLDVGVGGYILSRGAEKMLRDWKNKK